MKKQAFTIIELIVVIAVICIIGSIAVQGIQKTAQYRSVVQDKMEKEASQKNNPENSEPVFGRSTVTVTKTFSNNDSYFVSTEKGLYYIPTTLEGAKIFARILPNQKYEIAFSQLINEQLPRITQIKEATNESKKEQ